MTDSILEEEEESSESSDSGSENDTIEVELGDKESELSEVDSDQFDEMEVDTIVVDI